MLSGLLALTSQLKIVASEVFGTVLVFLVPSASRHVRTSFSRVISHTESDRNANEELSSGIS